MINSGGADRLVKRNVYRQEMIKMSSYIILKILIESCGTY